jgi:hypothetical protein
MTRDAHDGTPALLRQGLNVHGFGFHYSVIARIEQFGEEFGWDFVGAEVPLGLAEQDVHADFIFRCQRKHLYLVGECKRADPAVSHWGFARSRYSIGIDAPVTVDELHFPRADEDRLALRVSRISTTSGRPFQVGITVKTPRTGDGVAKDRRAITDCVTQVARATNGFLHLCAENARLVRADFGDAPVRVVSAIFTTARLSTARDDLSIADLASGHLPDAATFDDTLWLWHQHALTPSMQAKIQGRFVAEKQMTWGAYFRESAVRSIAVVSTGGIHDFLDNLDRL